MGKTWVLIAAILGSSMSFIDGTAVNVVLPIMQRDLQATGAQMQWVVEAYSLFLSALILVGGSFGDLYGRRKIFALGIAIFGVSSLACAVAPNVVLLILARAVQGIGGALAMPGSLALISAAYSGEERGRAIGTWSGFAAITSAAGPILGGVLAQTASWRWVFVINLPLTIAVLLIAELRVAESRDDEASHTIDATGAALATVGLGFLIYGLIELQGASGSPRGLGATAGGVLLLAGFVLAERRARHPMLPHTMFASRAFTVANLYTFALYMALGGSLYFLPFNLINVQGYSPTAAGAAFLPFILIQFLFSRWSGGLVARIGARIPLVAGGVLAGCAFLAFAVPGIGGSYWLTYFPAVLLLGAGGALFIAPLTTTVFDSSDPEQSGIASGINNAVARTAGLVAVALFGIALTTVFDRTFDARMQHLHVAPRTRALARAERAKFVTGAVPADIPAADRAGVRTAVQAGYVEGFRAVMGVSAVISLLAAGIAFVALPGRKLADDARAAA